MERCRKETPVLTSLDGSGREVACWLHVGGATVPTELAVADPGDRGLSSAIRRATR
jgi:hypothetical protein